MGKTRILLVLLDGATVHCKFVENRCIQDTLISLPTPLAEKILQSVVNVSYSSIYILPSSTDLVALALVAPLRQDLGHCKNLLSD